MINGVWAPDMSQLQQLQKYSRTVADGAGLKSRTWGGIKAGASSCAIRFLEDEVGWVSAFMMLLRICKLSRYREERPIANQYEIKEEEAIEVHNN